jgi:hypothetical protein
LSEPAISQRADSSYTCSTHWAKLYVPRPISIPSRTAVPGASAGASSMRPGSKTRTTVEPRWKVMMWSPCFTSTGGA